MPDDFGKALRESEERYRTLFAHAPFGIFLFDGERRITENNARLAQILRIDPATENVLAFLASGSAKFLPAIVATLNGEATTVEASYQPPGLEAPIHLSLRLCPVRDVEGAVSGGMGIVEDLSERVRAESALRASAQRAALHVQQNPLGVISWTGEGKVAEWNASAARIFGFTAEEAIGRLATLIIPEHALAEIQAVFKKLVDRTGGERNKCENLTKDGRLITCEWYSTPLVDDDGRVIGVTCLVEDVTAREAAMRALEKSEARFRTLIEHAPDAICVIQKGHFVYVNPAMNSYLGYRTGSQELEGQLAENFIHLADRPETAPRRPTRDDDEMLAPREYRLIRADGGSLPAEIVSMLIDYDGGPAVLVHGRDLTERKLMEAHLLQSDRMASVGTLASGVAHEINNPLA
ncbi:MAG: PAS domain S-box protein, partial [Polyangiaceae bacterium]